MSERKSPSWGGDDNLKHRRITRAKGGADILQFLGGSIIIILGAGLLLGIGGAMLALGLLFVIDIWVDSFIDATEE